jgi:predicted AlkP superfamily pyrophosphatase or phosphodiesterase
LALLEDRWPVRNKTKSFPGTVAQGVARAANSYQHVLLISIDGMHAVDLTNCISNSDPNKQCTNLAYLAKKAIIYPNALASAPSDSFPGLLALVTGGTPKSTGVF